jgi:hypothetical protein
MTFNRARARGLKLLERSMEAYDYHLQADRGAKNCAGVRSSGTLHTMAVELGRLQLRTHLRLGSRSQLGS